MESNLISALRTNADLAVTRQALRKEACLTDLAAAATRSEEAIATVAQALSALELAEIMLTVFGAEGERLERIRAAIARVERFA